MLLYEALGTGVLAWVGEKVEGEQTVVKTWISFLFAIISFSYMTSTNK